MPNILPILNTLPNGVTHLNMPLIKVKNPIKPCRKKLWILNTLPNGVIHYNNTLKKFVSKNTLTTLTFDQHISELKVCG